MLTKIRNAFSRSIGLLFTIAHLLAFIEVVFSGLALYSKVSGETVQVPDISLSAFCTRRFSGSNTYRVINDVAIQITGDLRSFVLVLYLLAYFVITDSARVGKTGDFGSMRTGTILRNGSVVASLVWLTGQVWVAPWVVIIMSGVVSGWGILKSSFQCYTYIM
eukprot:607550_1